MARAKRDTPEISSGSMADIAFLLLIFFLVTTTIASDKGILLVLPPKPDPNEPPPDIVKNQRNIFKILANSNDKLLVEDEPFGDLRQVGQLRSMVKDFVLNFKKQRKNANHVMWNARICGVKKFNRLMRVALCSNGTVFWPFNQCRNGGLNRR